MCKWQTGKLWRVLPVVALLVMMAGDGVGSLVATTAGGATNVSAGTVALQGSMTGGSAAEAYICWGAHDEGTVATGAWDHVVAVGTVSDGVVFSRMVSNLYYGIEYDYRVYVTDGPSNAWSDVATFTTLPGEVWGEPYLSNVDESKYYQVAYDFDIPTTAGWNSTPVPYSVDDSALIATGSFQRVAYYMELVSGGSTNWVWVAMDAFTSDASLLGVPNTSSGIFWHYGLTGPITNATILSNVGGITTGNAIDTVNLEFWPSNYNKPNDYGVPGASDTTYDFGDGGASMSAGHGAMQIHNYGAGETLFAYNEWGSGNGDLGIGNRPTGDPDWTFGTESSAYESRRLVVMVSTGAGGAGPVIANASATSIGATSATLEGSLEATQAVFTVTAYWSTSNNTDAAAWQADGTASRRNVGAFTNVAELVLSEPVSNLTSGVAYYYTFHASNEVTNVWATPNASFTTASAPAVDNAGGATDVLGAAATLHGELTDGGSATAYIVWGMTAPGALSTGAWEHVFAVGTVDQGSAFAANVSGLVLNTNYYYRCYVTNVVADAWSSVTNFSTSKLEAIYVGDGNTRNDRWNLPTSWDVGVVPSGAMNAIIPSGKYAHVWSADTPTYVGDLTIGTNATLQIGWTTVYPASYNALGTPGSTTIYLHSGSYIYPRMGGSPVMPMVQLMGDARMSLRSSTYGACSPQFDFGIHGPHAFTLLGKAGATVYLSVSNSFDGLVAKGTDGSGFDIQADAPGSLGTGDVTIEEYAANQTIAANLIVNSVDAIDDTATVSLSGFASATKVTMNTNDAIGSLFVDGYQYPAGTYGRVGVPVAVDYEYTWIDGDGVLTVLNAPVDTNGPVASFVDDQGGGPLYPEQPVAYTITFDEVHFPALQSNDLENASATPFVIDSFARTSASEYRVTGRATEPGTLQLQIKSGVAIEDAVGNSMPLPQADDHTFIVEPLPYIAGELGVWKPWANGRINPTTGTAWQIGDQYRLAFVSSENNVQSADTEDLTVYDAYLQGLAAASTVYPLLGNGTWKVIGSSGSVDARDHTGTNPATNGIGVAIFLCDGYTKIADSNSDLWDSSLDNTPNVDENGVGGYTYGNVATGSSANGTKRDSHLGGTDGTPPKVEYGRCTEVGSKWCLVYNGFASSTYPYYALSEPLTLVSGAPTGAVLIIR